MTDTSLVQLFIGALNLIVLALAAWMLRNLHLTLVRLAILETLMAGTCKKFEKLDKAFTKHVEDPTIHQKISEARR